MEVSNRKIETWGNEKKEFPGNMGKNKFKNTLCYEIKLI